MDTTSDEKRSGTSAGGVVYSYEHTDACYDIIDVANYPVIAMEIANVIASNSNSGQRYYSYYHSTNSPACIRLAGNSTIISVLTEAKIKRDANSNTMAVVDGSAWYMPNDQRTHVLRSALTRTIGISITSYDMLPDSLIAFAYRLGINRTLSRNGQSFWLSGSVMDKLALSGIGVGINASYSRARKPGTIRIKPHECKQHIEIALLAAVAMSIIRERNVAPDRVDGLLKRFMYTWSYGVNIYQQDIINDLTSKWLPRCSFVHRYLTDYHHHMDSVLTDLGYNMARLREQLSSPNFTQANLEELSAHAASNQVPDSKTCWAQCKITYMHYSIFAEQLVKSGDIIGLHQASKLLGTSVEQDDVVYIEIQNSTSDKILDGLSLTVNCPTEYVAINRSSHTSNRVLLAIRPAVWAAHQISAAVEYACHDATTDASSYNTQWVSYPCIPHVNSLIASQSKWCWLAYLNILRKWYGLSTKLTMADMESKMIDRLVTLLNRPFSVERCKSQPQFAYMAYMLALHPADGLKITKMDSMYVRYATGQFKLTRDYVTKYPWATLVIIYEGCVDSPYYETLNGIIRDSMCITSLSTDKVHSTDWKDINGVERIKSQKLQAKGINHHLGSVFVESPSKTYQPMTHGSHLTRYLQALHHNCDMSENWFTVESKALEGVFQPKVIPLTRFTYPIGYMASADDANKYIYFDSVCFHRAPVGGVSNGISWRIRDARMRWTSSLPVRMAPPIVLISHPPPPIVSLPDMSVIRNALNIVSHSSIKQVTYCNNTDNNINNSIPTTPTHSDTDFDYD